MGSTHMTTATDIRSAARDGAGDLAPAVVMSTAVMSTAVTSTAGTSTALARVAPQGWRCRVLAHWALAEALLGDLRAACATAEQARHAASDAREPDGLAAAELALAWVCVQRSDDCGAESHADAAAAHGVGPTTAPVLTLVRAELCRMRGAQPAAPPAVRPAAPLAVPPPRRPVPTMVDPLTARELEVLRHLDALLPTEEIASEMFISVNTVKTHVRAILRKLAAQRRYDAVRRARQLGLL